MSNKTALKQNFKNGELKTTGLKNTKLKNMKKLLILFVAFTLSTGAFAQHNMDNMEKMDMKKDHMMMKNGKMEMVKAGKTMAMDKDMTLTNGTTVSTGGMVKMKDGKTMQMKEGEMMYMDGKMGVMPKKAKKGKMGKMGKM